MPPVPELPYWLQWLYVVGEPAIANEKVFEGPFGWILTIMLGGMLSWVKVLGLFCLLAWLASMFFKRKSATAALSPVQNSIQIYMAAAVMVLGLVAALLGVMEQTGRLKLMAWGPYKPGVWIGLFAGAMFVFLLEWRAWTAVSDKDSKADKAVLVALHFALIFGYWVSYSLNLYQLQLVKQRFMAPEQVPDWRVIGARLAATYMGLVVFARVAISVLVEVSKIRFGRLYAIAWLTIKDANRRMWAPYVVVGVFVVILAFTHWFLRVDDNRSAELSKMFVGTLTLLSSLLVILMVGIIAPIGMPHDIQTQTIYTVVSKPVRRLELIWGRLIGYMALVTFLLAIFGGASLFYLHRTIWSQIDVLKNQAKEYETTRPDFAKLAAAQADQLETRMSARIAVKGSLTFVDSKKKERTKGIDVGQEQDVRSHIEGATPSKAVWKFGVIPDPYDNTRMRNLVIPVSSLLVAGTIESIEDRLLNLKDDDLMASQAKAKDMKPADANKFAAEQKQRQAEIAKLEAELKTMKDKDQALRLNSRKAGITKTEAQDLRNKAVALHSPPIPVEMTFNIYRTTKGVVGEPVLASMIVTNAFPLRTGMKPHPDLFPVREYYTNKRSIPSSLLVGSHGFLTVEIRCVTPNQYLGMAESDLYILSDKGPFWLNFVKGLLGIWLRAMVLTAIGLFAGTFLSWPVALLTTIAFFFFGELAFNFLALFSLQLEGGGPFESMIRIKEHQNMMNPLAPTASVIVAKTFDAILMPVMSRLVYLVPNFGALDVSNTVAEGFAVQAVQIRNLVLLGLGYTLPFTIAAYFILKNREVAA